MSYIALHYVRVNRKMYTPGEIIHEEIPQEKSKRLLEKGAIREENPYRSFDYAAQLPAPRVLPTEGIPEDIQERRLAPDPQPGTEPEEEPEEGAEEPEPPPEINIMEGIVEAKAVKRSEANAATKKPAAKKPSSPKKPAGRRS